MKMNKTSYLCIGNIGYCRNTADISMKIVFSDGTMEEYTKKRILEREDRAPNVMLRDNDLMISSKRLDRKTDKAIAAAELRLINPNGSVESFNLKWGIADFDIGVNDYTVKWDNSILRFDVIRITSGEQDAEVEFSMSKKVVIEKPKPAGSKQHEKSADDLKGCIEADRGILKYYNSDLSTQALDLLERAESYTNIGNYPSAARSLAEAEEIIRGCALDAARSVKAYYEYINM